MLSLAGASVDTASNGLEACQMFMDSPDKYNLILMDADMPDMDGYQAAEMIRAVGLSQSETLPIVAMVENLSEQSASKCRDSGMNDSTPNPVDTADLRQKLNQYLS